MRLPVVIQSSWSTSSTSRFPCVASDTLRHVKGSFVILVVKGPLMDAFVLCIYIYIHLILYIYVFFLQGLDFRILVLLFYLFNRGLHFRMLVFEWLKWVLMG